MTGNEHRIKTEKYDDPGYERRDVNVKVTLVVTGITVVFILACLVFLDDVFVSTKENMYAEMTLKPVSITLTDLRASEIEAQTTYKLLNPQKGIYRIPIDRAMELVLSEAVNRKSPSQQVVR